MLELTILLTIALPIAWFCSEFQERKWLRISLGMAAIAVAYLVATAVGMLEQLNYNAWYGDASQKLVETTLKQLQANNGSRVIENLEWLRQTYQPTYENRANYDELIAQYEQRF